MMYTGTIEMQVYFVDSLDFLLMVIIIINTIQNIMNRCHAAILCYMELIYA